MDHDAPTQNSDIGKCPVIESTANAFEKIRGQAAERSFITRIKQSEAQFVSERNRRSVRYRQEYHVSPCKALQILFLAKIQ